MEFVPALPLGPDEAGRFEHVEMLRERGQGHLERLGKAAHRLRPARQPLDHRHARGIGKGVEHAIESELLLRHSPKYKWLET